MTEPANRDDTRKPFLDVTDAEVVNGPDVIAGEVSEALKDADRFGLPGVKPPLVEALGRVKGAGTSAGTPEDGAIEQDALSGVHAEVDENAGSAEMLKPDEAARPA